MRDIYRWMEQNDTPQVQQWLEIQARKTEEYLSSIPDRETLTSRFTELFSTDSICAPTIRNGKYFTRKRLSGQDLSVIYVQKNKDEEPRILLDPNTFSSDKSVTLTNWNPSNSGKLLVYGVSTSGNDQHNLRIINVDTGETYSDEISDEYYPRFGTWNLEETGFWYIRHDTCEPMIDAKLYQRVYFHKIGTDFLEDERVFGEKLNKDDYLGVSSSQDKKYLLVSVMGQNEENGNWWTEFFYSKTMNEKLYFTPLLVRFPTLTGGTIEGDYFYRISAEDTLHGCVKRVNLLSENLIEEVFIPEDEGFLKDILLMEGNIFTLSLKNVYSSVKQYDKTGKLITEFSLPIGTVNWISDGEKNELQLSFESFTQPETIYCFNVKTKELRMYDQEKVNFDPSLFEAKQEWYPSKDGTSIPMFLIYKKGMEKTGDNPLVLYGYGGFNISLTPEFSNSIIPFLEKGGIYAIANIRGGGEFGGAWYQAGTQRNKQNVFDDFIAGAEWLICEKYTRKEKLAISGGSNGGLLTLVVATQRPDLVQAVVSAVPVADMLRFHKYFGGVYWIPDYGDPENKEMRNYLLTYSPYHNVKNGEKYPAIYISTSDGDDRVHPMHSYKMVARLQSANISENPILLRVELKAGHSGGGAVSKQIASLADEWSFLFKQLRIE